MLAGKFINPTGGDVTRIKVTCPNCQAELSIPDEMLGHMGRCPACKSEFLIELPIDNPESNGDPPASSADIMNWLDEAGKKDKLKNIHTAPGPRKRAPTRLSRVVATTSQTGRTGPARKPRSKLPVRLDHIDEMGVFFRFDPDLLYNEDFRSSFPQQCLICGAKKPLSVHVVFWSSKLPSTQAKAAASHHARQVYTLRKVSDLSGKDLLSVIDPIGYLPEPYSLPFPYYVCSSCSNVGAIITDVHLSGGREVCELGISSLPQAEFFTLAVCGRGSEAHEKVRQAIKDGYGRPWQQLPLTVRIRINRWYKADEGERFLCYIPDAEFAKAEAGLAGVVLTDLRLIFHKSLGQLEIPRTEHIELEAIDTESGMDLAIIAPNGKRVVLRTNQTHARQLQQLMLRTDT